MLKPLSSEQWNFTSAAHLLNRAGFGGTPTEIERLVALSPSAAVTHLTSYDDAANSALKPEWAQPDPARAEKLRQAKDASPEQRKELLKEFQREQRRRMLELQEDWLRLMTTGPHPLQEKLTLFWHGHFATSVTKVKDAYYMWRQNDTFRRLGAGDWLTLLREVTRDPAMLVWLDQAQSKPAHPNENYARELMELFTLGEGNYTEKDVTEAARALTGLTLDRLRQEPTFRPRLRDASDKTLFGKTGNFNGDDLLKLIVAQPQSARFITIKLWRYFAGTEPSPELAEALAAEFRRHDNRFRPFLRTMFLAEEFHSPAVVRQQIKSPVQLLVMACRQLERELPPPLITSNALRNLGQEPFNPPNVKGWDGGIAWINTNTLLSRHNLALMLTTGENALPATPRKAAAKKLAERVLNRLSPHAANPDKVFTAEDRQSPDRLLAVIERRFLNAPLRAQDRAALVDYLHAQGDLDNHDLLGLIRLAMCTADYQLA
ncbi:MAG TPA: DUF1800 domain-containing protein [Candidatus Limnocylindria bacterium]|nr:DUF1800 domain-containing protein [Candidatus Limnocylindria bacterium]